jgi:beta-hydroxyacyl-ACP dehydratase FabZ
MASNYNINEIMARLPHRYPFILIDRILELEPGKHVVALKNVTINEPFFQGHFPGNPVMPGVLIVEAMAQAGGVLAIETLPEDKRALFFYFMGIDKVRFRQPAVPGDQLIFNIEFLKQRLNAVKMAGKVTVDDKLVMEGEMMAALGDKV